ncbi:MAG TPA: hypothetical protein VLE96_04035 [Chlamydiales bacterium]|nr:hypothetical protein [Chlamydiales bacterium]
MKKRFGIFFVLLFTFIYADEVIVDLRNPTYCHGVLYTNEGGVIQGNDIRIQARHIQYTQKEDLKKIEAEGDLLIQFKEKIYVGNRLEYDFVSRTGTIFQGKTSAAMLFVSGDEIQLLPDGSYKIKDVTLTTCENKESTWDFYANQVNVIREEFFEAKQLRARSFKTPFFWFPSFKLSLKKFRESIVRSETPYKWNIDWDKGQGPRVAFRYKLFSKQDFAAYGRLEYRWSTGWGGSFETEYFPEHQRTTFVTRSFAGTNRLQTAPDRMFRYRLQGAYRSTSEDKKTTAALVWDKYNDVRMPTIFRPDDFEVSTAKKTILYIRHQDDPYITSLRVRPRANSFESIKQDLPSIYGHLHPHAIGNTGIYNFLSMKAAYVDFAYSDDLVVSLKDYRSGRLEIREKMQRSFPMGPLTFTPYIGTQGILYTNSPSGKVKGLGVLQYGFDLVARGEKTFSRYKHVIEPYLWYTVLTRPTVDPDDHYIFTIADGVDKINQIQTGFRTLLFSKRRLCKEASFSADLYINAFFKDKVIPQLVPRGYLLLNWRLPSLNFSFHNAWNFRHHLLDVSKARLQWTLSENVAMSLETRYRSKYDWRKADHESFILDVTRSETQLLLSPLTDRRITVLGNIFVRLNPLWETRIWLVNGFYRENETPYTEVKIDLSTWITSALKIRLSYSHIRNDDRVSFDFELVKRQF